MITLCMATYRPGGIDVFAESFKGLPPDADYEVLICDDYPGRVERGTVPAFLLEKGIRLGWYGKGKPKSYPDAKGGLANAWNTMLMRVRGNHVLFLSDYTWLPSCWLDQWQWVIKNSDRKMLTSGGGILYLVPKPTIVDDIRTWDVSVTPTTPRPWVAWKWESFYALYPMDYWLAANGVDERVDHCHCWQVSADINQSAQLGYSLQVLPEITCYMVDHRVWDSSEESAPVGCGGEGLWKITHKQSLPEEPVWQARSPNPFDLVEKRNGL